MQSDSKKVLFISHDASRTGAPILLLNLLRWLKANSDISFEVLLNRGGVLESDFKALAPVTVFKPGLIGNNNIIGKALYYFGFKKIISKMYYSALLKKFKKKGIALLYCSTATNGALLELLSHLRCPVITHVHELEYMIRYYSGLEDFSLVRKYTQRYIAVSQAVKANLMQNHGIADKKIDLVYEYIPTDLNDQVDLQRTSSLIRKELNIPEDSLIVGASGTIDWRKGSDLFIQLARAVNKQRPDMPVHFVWVGGESERYCLVKLRHDIRKLSMEKCVHFPGVKTNPLDYFATFDLFAMVSREDPFPIVNLEVACLGKPIVCFDDSGGTKEFVEDDCGFVVPYLDIEAMATKAIVLLESEELRNRFGQRAKKKVRERHDIANSAAKICEIIEGHL